MVSIKTKVGPKGQVVIPKIFRDEYNILPGDDILVDEGNQELIVRKSIIDPIKTFSDLAHKIKLRKKINIHAIEEEYEERWQKTQRST